MELEYGGRRFPVAEGELVLGSNPAATVVLAGTQARHAIVKALGERMATIRAAAPGAEISVNGVTLGTEPTPLMHGDVVRIGDHEIRVLNPSHPAGSPNTPPPGARERLHDTLFGLPKTATPVTGSAPVERPAEPKPAPGGHLGIIIAAVVTLALLAWFLLR